MTIDLKTIFKYLDGNLYYLKKPNNHCKLELPAGWESTHNGKRYKRICINKKSYYLHQIIFCFHYGFIPKYIDHKDGNSLNNKIDNLREATQSQNVHNSPKRKNNKSGVKGVCWVKNRWLAQIGVNNKNIVLGRFEKLEEAAKAYEHAAVLYFGEFAKATNRLQDRAHQ